MLNAAPRRGRTHVVLSRVSCTVPQPLEVNFDGLVGPTHNYAGLSFGNVASESNTGAVSRPRDAALQGLAKMRETLAMGLPQGVFPPQERPHVPTLRALGFTGSDDVVIETVAEADPVLLAQTTSASCMWTANAASVAPSSDTADGKVHFTAANLRSMAHRFIEGPQTAHMLRAIFADRDHFVVHDPLPAADAFGDEGAANHTRLFDDLNSDSRAVHLFNYGVHAANRAGPRPSKFPARQTREACEAVARLHGLDPERCVFWQQNPAAIDAGAFHNDVVSVGTGRVLLYHELAFLEPGRLLDTLAEKLGPNFTPVCVPEANVPLTTAVQTYLFNSQLVTMPDGSYTLIAPTESQDNAMVRAAIQSVIDDGDNPIRRVVFKNLRESMRNGGGPACLRLRVPMTPQELAITNPFCLMTPVRLDELEGWVCRHYPAELRPEEIRDPRLMHRSRRALDELTKILNLGPLYEFQRK